MVQRKKCRSRQELSNDYLLAKLGFDTAENEPPKGAKNVCSEGPRWAHLAQRSQKAAHLAFSFLSFAVRLGLDLVSSSPSQVVGRGSAGLRS